MLHFCGRLGLFKEKFKMRMVTYTTRSVDFGNVLFNGRTVDTTPDNCHPSFESHILLKQISYKESILAN